VAAFTVNHFTARSVENDCEKCRHEFPWSRLSIEKTMSLPASGRHVARGEVLAHEQPREIPP